MQRSKLRRAVAALPPAMPEHMIEKAIKLVRNTTTRTRIRARYQRAESAR